VTQPRPVYNFRLSRDFESLQKRVLRRVRGGLVSDLVAKALIIGRLVRPQKVLMSHSDLPLNVIKLLRLSKNAEVCFSAIRDLQTNLKVAALTAASNGAVNLCSS
jgi:hypothetical protein